MKTSHLFFGLVVFALITSIGLNSVSGASLTASNFPPPNSSSLPAAVPAEHSNITSYNGSSTCIACHRQEAEAMFGAVHYQWTGATPNVPNIPGNAGKGEMGFNTYCGSVETSRHVACYSCHAGAGLAPNNTMSDAQLSNIDCMTCHQEKYLRTPAPPFENLTFTDYLGTNHTWQLPVEDAQGNFHYVIDEAKMPVSAVVAAQTVHTPTRTTCLSCHAYAAGSNCGKRGDLSSGMVNPPLAVDVHMSPQGANLTCQDCHQFTDHHVLGRGLDIRENDVAGRLTCTSPGCHASPPHSSTDLNNHISAVACQACHIPEYAKLGTTEMTRDWNQPWWFPGMFSNQGGYKPGETRQGNVTPTYAWFNGTSYVYVRGQVPPLRPDGMYEFAAPYGSVNDGKIVPMKEHTGNSAMLTSTHQMIPYSTFTYFVTGDFNRAVQAGQQYFNMTGPWSMPNVHTYQTINHQVEPSSNALQCSDCHEAYAGGTPRMDLQGSLGYTPKQPLSTTCSQCHDRENNPGFVEVHDKHVTGEEIDCSSCHTFSRTQTQQNSTTNIGVVRFNNTWLLDASGDGVWGAGDIQLAPFGHAGDRYVTGDWTGNGITKIGVVRNNRTWLLDASGDGVWGAGDIQYTSFGQPGDVYVTGDWNNDLKTEIGVVRFNTTWLLDGSGNGAWGPGDYQYIFGKAGDKYVTGKWI